MAYRIGIANGYLDMLYMLYKFVTSAKMVTSITYTPGNTGNGYISAEWADDSSGIVDESWIIQFDSATTFTVTGQSGGYGLQINTGTVGTPYVSDNGETGFTVIVSNIAWVSGDTIVYTTGDGIGSTQKWTTNRYNMVYDSGITYGPLNQGDGSIGNPNYDMNAPAETWTITAVGLDGGSTEFQVEGSVTGATANAVAGTPYDNGYISFTISEASSGTPWDYTSGAADYITVVVPEAREIMFEAPGNGGTEEIYMGIKTFYQNYEGDDVFQWLLNGYTGFNPDAHFASQPGELSTGEGTTPRCVLQDREMPYWIVANGRRVMMFYEVDNVIECMHMGFILGYGNPVENPYPLAIGGTTVFSTHPVTSQSTYHRAFFNGPCWAYNNSDYTTFRVWDGAYWNNLGGETEAHLINYSLDHNGANWPYFSSSSWDLNFTHSSWAWDVMSRNSDNSYTLFPIIPIVHKPNRIIFGEIQGLYATPGDGLNREDVTTIDGTDYVFFNNVSRNASDEWCCLKLE